MRAWLVIPLIALASCVSPAAPQFRRHRIGGLGAKFVAGNTIDGSVLFTWGDGIQRRVLPSGNVQTIARGTFAEGGCLMDVDRDGQLDLIVNQTGEHPELVWFHAPDWARHVIDTGVDSLDMLPATIFARRGLLLIHKRNQVRFYEPPPADPRQRWRETELYSFYTPSDEGGMRIADVDSDGLPDILCGNYWMQSPKELELPWHLFAIDLNEPNSLAVADFDGDGRLDILVAEREGEGRLIIFHNDGAGHFAPKALARTDGIIAAAAIHLRKSGKPDILIIGKRELSLWKFK